MQKLAIFTILLLTATPSSAEDYATCQRYGYAPGTPLFAQCMMTIDQARQANAMRLLQNNALTPVVPYQMPTSMPHQTTCQGFGNQFTCTGR